MNEPMKFESWLDGLFSPLVADDAWTKDGHDVEEVSDDVRVERLTRLFRGCGKLLAPYDDDRVGRGLDYLSSRDIADYSSAVFAAPPDTARVACVEAMLHLYSDLWAKRCPNRLDDDGEKSGPLAASCFMWWERLNYKGTPATGRKGPAWKIIDDAVLKTLTAALSIPHLRCQESALHGLNHWHQAHPAEVEKTVSAFIAATPGMDPLLREYAEGARKGLLR